MSFHWKWQQNTIFFFIATQKEMHQSKKAQRKNLVQRPSHVVLAKIGISRFFRDFTQKLGFQAKYMDFRHWPHLQPMQATPLLTASHRILSSVARLSGAHGHLKSPKKCPEIHENAWNPDFCEIPIFGKPHGKGPGHIVKGHTKVSNSDSVIWA